MCPDIFKPLFDFLHIPYIGAYMSFLLISLITSLPIFYVSAKKFGLTPWKQMFISPAGIIIALVFSRIFHILFEGRLDYYLTNLRETGISYLFTEMLNIVGPGQVFYGGMVGGYLAIVVFTAIFYPKDKSALIKNFDSLSIASLNGLWITRLGCFCEGCCFGRPSKLFGIRFPQNSPTMFALYRMDPHHTSLFSATQPLIPTQLIHSASNLVIFIILLRMMNSEKYKPGLITSTSMILYSITRFFIEFLRYDQRGGFGPFSTSQWISIPLLLLGLYLRKKYQQNSEVSNDKKQLLGRSGRNNGRSVPGKR